MGVLRETANGGKLSAKRIIAFILVLTIVLVVVGEMFFGYCIEEYMFESLIDGLIWITGFIGGEKIVGALPIRGSRFQPKPSPPASYDQDQLG